MVISSFLHYFSLQGPSFPVGNHMVVKAIFLLQLGFGAIVVTTRTRLRAYEVHSDSVCYTTFESLPSNLNETCSHELWRSK